MSTNAISRRYAKALLTIGLDDRKFELYGQQIKELAEAMQPSLSALASPLLTREQKKQVIDEIVKAAKAETIVGNFLKIMLDKGRIKELPSVAEAYQELSDEAAGRIRGVVRSVEQLDEATLAQLRVKLTKKLGKTVALESTVDTDLLGGMQAKVGSLVIDGSISGQLQRFESLLRKD